MKTKFLFVFVAISLTLFCEDTCAEGATPGVVGELPAWADGFSVGQRRELVMNGCRFDEDDREAFISLRRRGFSTASFVMSYKKLRDVSIWYPGIVEDVVVIQYLGLDARRYLRLKAERQPGLGIEDYYEYKTRKPARGLKIAGALMLPGGLAMGIIGPRLAMSDGSGDEGFFAGIAMMIMSIPVGVAGLTMLIVGLAKTYPTPQEGELDRGHISRLKKFRTRKAKKRDRRERSRARVTVTPIVSLQSFGLGLAGSF